LYVRQKDKWEESFIMGKKQIALLTLAVLLVPSVCMAALPAVQLTSGCSYRGPFDDQGKLLLDSLALFIDSLPNYATADLENAMAGDGVPDSYQLGLLAAAMCAGETNLQAQYAFNKNLVATKLIAPLTPAAGLLFGTTGHPGIYQQAIDLSAALKAWALTAGLPAELATSANSIAAQIDGIIVQIDGFLGSLTVAQLQQYVTIALPLLGQVEDLLAGLVGLDSEMIGILYTLVTPDLIAEIDGVIADVRTQYIPMIQAVVTQGGALVPTALVAQLNMAATDLGAAADLVEPFVAFVAAPGFKIYGVGAKTLTEPFSGLGDYNGDGVSNATVYSTLLRGGEGSRPIFVEVASGFAPYQAAPVAGMFGMALLAGVVALGGALSLRKK
jgi:hypothetical protein